MTSRRHHGLVRLTHWLNAIVLTGLIASGLQIYGAFPHFGPRGEPSSLPNPFDGNRFQGFPEWARLGGWLAGGLNWHIALAWPFVLSGLLYLVFLIGSGEWRSLLFMPRDVKPALQMAAYYLRLRREPPPQGKHNALQKNAYTSIVALGAIALGSPVSERSPHSGPRRRQPLRGVVRRQCTPRIRRRSLISSTAEMQRGCTYARPVRSRRREWTDQGITPIPSRSALPRIR